MRRVSREASRRHGVRAAGFTLVEVMIALTLMSALMLGLVSAMATLGTTAGKLEDRAASGGERRLVLSFLRSALSQVPKGIGFQTQTGETRVFFAGTPGELEWLGNMPARHGIGGLHHFRLQVVDEAGVGVLVLHYLPFAGGDAMPDWALAGSHRLAEHVTRFSLAYEPRPTPEAPVPVWYDAWAGSTAPPGRVRLDLDVDGVAWPPLWVVVRAPDVRGGVRIVRGLED